MKTHLVYLGELLSGESILERIQQMLPMHEKAISLMMKGFPHGLPEGEEKTEYLHLGNQLEQMGDKRLNANYEILKKGKKVGEVGISLERLDFAGGEYEDDGKVVWRYQAIFCGYTTRRNCFFYGSFDPHQKNPRLEINIGPRRRYADLAREHGLARSDDATSA